MNDNLTKIINLFSSLNQCEESNVCILITRDLDCEDLLKKVCFAAWVYDRNAPSEGVKAFAAEFPNDAIDELYYKLYDLALKRKKELGSAFSWTHQKANSIIESEDLGSEELTN